MAKTREERKAYQHTWYLKNRVAILARVKAYANKNTDYYKAYRKAYYATNKKQQLAKSKVYYEANRQERIAYQAALHQRKAETVKAYKKMWWETGREKHLAKKRSHYYKNWAQFSEKQKQAYARNPEPFREHVARRRARMRTPEVEKIDFREVLFDSNGLCGICHKPLDLFGIDFDHIVPLSKGGTHTRANLQATHSYCNRSKGAKVG